MQLDPLGMDFPHTWGNAMDYAIYDWSGVTCVVVCTICHEQQGPTFNVKDAEAEQSKHRAIVHADTAKNAYRRVSVPQRAIDEARRTACVDCGKKTRTARWLCSTCTAKHRTEWLQLNGFMLEGESIWKYEQRERAERGFSTVGRWAGHVIETPTPKLYSYNTCEIDGCSIRVRAPKTICYVHAREAAQEARPYCTVPGCKTKPHQPGLCSKHKQEKYAA